MAPEQELIQRQIRCVSHEIRNQLSICDVYSEILKKHLEKENISNPAVYNALNCIKKAIKLIGNNLIDLKGFDNITLKIFDSKILLDECAELSKIYIQDKNIDIITKFEADAKIYVDELKLQGCIINIIKNSIESIISNGIIEISSKKQDNMLSIRISNNGKPIQKKTAIRNI